MIYIDLTYQADMTKPIPVIAIPSPFVYGDSQAHRITVQAADGGNFSGTVTADFINSAGDASTIVGSIENGKAVCVFPQRCYLLPGSFALLMHITNGEQTTTILNLRGVVGQSYSSFGVIPSEVEQTVAQILDRYTQDVQRQDEKINQLEGEHIVFNMNFKKIQADIEFAQNTADEAINNLNKLNKVQEAVLATWKLGYFNPVNNSTKGRSSTATSYRRTNPTIEAQDGETVYIETPEGYKSFVVWFSAEPDYTNGADNTAIYVDAIQATENLITFTYDSRYHYAVCIDLRDASGAAQAVVYPDIYHFVDKQEQEIDKISDILLKNETLTETTRFTIKNALPETNVIISCKATFTGNPMQVYAVYPNGNTLKYPVHGEHTQEWRIPPMDENTGSITLVAEIPSGSSTHVESLRYRFDNAVRQGAILYHSHFGIQAPAQTVKAALNAAKAGFRSLIMVPKETASFDADGDVILVANHDDTKAGITLKTATIEQIKTINMGGGEKMATIEELFEICSKTGMHPMFSVHPDLSDAGWQTVKKLLTKYGLTNRMQVKSAPTSVASMNNPASSILAHAHQYLGDDIESYTLDINLNSFNTNWMSAMKALTWYDPKLCKMEYIEANDDPAHQITKELITPVIEEGMKVSAASTSNGERTVDRMKQLIEFGVTEFTDDNFISFGLNW